MKSLGEKIAEGEPLMRQALKAWREYEEEGVEQLRIEAEWLIAAVQQYQFSVLGGSACTAH